MWALKWLLGGAVVWCAVGGDGKVTRAVMKELTVETEALRGDIVRGGGEGDLWEAGSGQMVLGGGRIEEIVTTAIHTLCADLLVELDRPLALSTGRSQDPPDCEEVKDEFRRFLGATVWFLYEVRERRMGRGWGRESTVRGELVWLQSLWASRRANTQDRSFIEQMMELYGETGCWGKSKEVLRRDVELVEFMNDLIESFG